jgi:voltage-gated potassium channel
MSTKTLRRWQARLHEIIFEADTPEGKAFDVALLIAILGSVSAVVLESVTEIRLQYGAALLTIEWIFTALFTLEYVLRLLSVGKPMRYALSFFGLVDLLSILPTYLSVFFVGTRSLSVIRALRLLRVFRVLKLGHFVGAERMLLTALKASIRKITIFLGVVLTMVLILGSLMYLIEGEEHGFTSIPVAVYWAIVTLTTVGYGDIAPQTVLGQFLASVVMVMGYGIIAVPTGIVSVEMAAVARGEAGGLNTQSCPQCSREGHDSDARFCKSCGTRL